MLLSAAVALVVAGLGGGLSLVRASSGTTSSFVPVTPARVLDTRVALGLPGPLSSLTPATVQITGPVPTPDGTTTVVPAGATAVVLNVTAVEATADGFFSVRPDGTPGDPTTSNLNFVAGDIVPNAVTVALPSNGRIELTYDAYGAAGPVSQALVDITGYYVETPGSGGAPAPAGPPGPAGPAGPAGPTGPQGPATVGEVFSNATGVPGNLETEREPAVFVESLTTDQPGKLVIHYTAAVTNNCSEPTSVRWYFLTINGEPIPSSAVTRTSGSPTFNGTLVGATGTLPAGTHTVGVGMFCVTGTSSSATLFSPHTSTIMFVP